MALLLTVIGPKDESLGERGSIVFGVGGGRIGRALDNDWVLPDPLRYLSSHHARVKFRKGAYFIEDTSTNGVYLNDADEPLGKSGPQPLHNGDLLRFGSYQVQVSVNDDSGPPVDPSVIVPFAPAAVPATAAAVERDIGADFDLDQLLIEQSSSSNRVKPVDAFGQPVFGDSGLQPLQALPSMTQVPAPAPLPAEPQPRLAVAEYRREQRAANTTDNGIEAFCRGAGIDIARLPPEAQSRALHLAGLLLRETLVGAKDLAGTQREIRQRAGMQGPKQDADRESLQRLPVEDLLLRLLGGAHSDSLDAVQWLRELFGMARTHDVAMMRALRSALADFIQRLEPKSLGNGRALAERFRNLTDMPDGQLPHLFGEALARSFEEEIQHPST